MNEETLRELQALYVKLRGLDHHLESLLTPHSTKPLQGVKFYQLTPTYSGPVEYEPRHQAAGIVDLIVIDLQIERSLVVTRIHDLGFETPPQPRRALSPHQDGGAA